MVHTESLELRVQQKVWTCACQHIHGLTVLGLVVQELVSVRRLRGGVRWVRDGFGCRARPHAGGARSRDVEWACGMGGVLEVFLVVS